MSELGNTNDFHETSKSQFFFGTPIFVLPHVDPTRPQLGPPLFGKPNSVRFNLTKISSRDRKARSLKTAQNVH